jgi:Leucine-rich repeat (LRR) protein
MMRELRDCTPGTALAIKVASVLTPKKETDAVEDESATLASLLDASADLVAEEVTAWTQVAQADWSSATASIHVLFDNASSSVADTRLWLDALDAAIRAAPERVEGAATSVADVLLYACASSGETVLGIVARRTADSDCAAWFELYFELVGQDRSAVTRVEPPQNRPPIVAFCAASADAELAKRFLLTSDAERALVAQHFKDSDSTSLTSCLQACVKGRKANVAMLRLLVECDESLAQLDDPTMLPPPPEASDPVRHATLLHDACANSDVCDADVLDFLCKLHAPWATTQNGQHAAPLLVLCHSSIAVAAASIEVLCKNGGASTAVMTTAHRGTDWAPLEALARSLCDMSRTMQSAPFRPQIQFLDATGHITPPSKHQKVMDHDEKRAAQYRADLQRYELQKKAFDADQKQRRERRPPFRDECITALLANSDDAQRACTLLTLSGAEKDTILHFAVRQDLPSLITAVLAENPVAHKLLKKANGANELPDALARKLGATACLGALSGMSADDVRQGDSASLLANAIRSGNDVVVELVLQQNPEHIGADLGKARGSPLNWAIACGRRFIVELLLRTADDKASQLVASSHIADFRHCLHQAVVLQHEPIVGVLARCVNLTPLIDDDLLRLACRNTTILATLIREVIQEHHKQVVALREQAESADPPPAAPLPTLASAFAFVGKHWDLSGLGLAAVQFPPEVRHLGVEKIDLSSNGLLQFPVSVLNFKSLVDLKLGNNLISDISARRIIASLRLATTERVLSVSLRRNRLTFIPPELYTLKNVHADTSKNPLVTSLVFPAWFFGLSYDRLVLAAIDLFFLGVAGLIVLVGRLFANDPSLRVAIFAGLLFYFLMLFLGSWALGLSKILWSDSAYSPLACCNADALAAAQRDDDAVQSLADDFAEAAADDDGGDGDGDEENDGGDQFGGLSSAQLDGARDKAIELGVKQLKKLASSDDVKKTCGSVANVLAVLTLVLELPTLLSLSFSADIWPQQLIDAFQFFQLNIRLVQNALGNPSLDIVLYHCTFWLSVALVLLQRLLLELSRYRRIASPAATFLQSSLSLTLLPVFLNLVKVFDCTYSEAGGAQLDELSDTTVQCWADTQHLVLVCVSFVCIAIYYPLAVLTVPIWQNRADGLSIKFPSYFLIMSGQLKMLLSLLVTFFSDQVFLYLGLNLFATVLLLGLVTTLRSPFLELASPYFGVMWSVKVARIGSYAVTVIGAIAALITASVDTDAFSIGSFFTMLGVDFLVGIVCGAIIKRGPRSGPPAEVAKRAVDNDDDDNGDVRRGDVELTSAASARESKRAPTHAMCQDCGLRPVQALIRKGDVEAELCRSCIKQRAYSLKATKSELNVINSGLRERNAFYTVRSKPQSDT